MRKYWVKAAGPEFSDLSRMSHSSMSSVAFLLNASSELDQSNPLFGLKRPCQMCDSNDEDTKLSTFLLNISLAMNVTKQK